MSERQRIIARCVRAGRLEVVSLERRDRRGLSDAVSAVIERQGRGFVGLYRASGLVDDSLAELREAASAGGDPVEIPLADAHRRLGRAVLAHRIAGRTLPVWAEVGHALLGDLAQLTAQVEDVYLCAGCERPLPPARQIARARAAGDLPLEGTCPSCTGGVAHSSEAERHVARAWLRLLAGEVRQALVQAARAEGARAPAERLDAVRGAAMLRLSNPVQACAYLRRAVEHDPADHWVRAKLVEALTRSGYLASASAELARLVSRRPQLASRTGALALALATARRTPTAANSTTLEGALSSLASQTVAASA